ncbi:MAG: DUF3592 domain-containing protein [Rubritalea sp.]|uniref:DUF3592 domain-containing protein n=1 Tax=Rubritalea sp. TaxID=2109375 RepID=UPI00324297C6
MSTIRFRSHNKGTGGSSTGGKYFLIIFGLIWTAFSSLFVVLGVKSSLSDAERSSWPTTPCEVEHFKVKSKLGLDPAFQPAINYSYSWKDTEYTGTKIWQDKEGEDDYHDLAELIDVAHEGKITECYVNPQSPSEAVIYPTDDSDWVGLIFAIFGGCFVLLGLGLLTMGIKSFGKKDKALSSKKKEEAGKFILIPFFGIFGLAGFAVLIFFVLPMWQKYFAAQSWETTTGTVVWSQVRTHDGDDGDTYSADIFYKYNHGGRVYKSNSVGLMGGSSSGRSGKQDKVNDHPRGKQITCFVNPENPHDSLLEREMGWWAAFTLFPLPFIAVGVGGLIFGLKKQKKKKALSASAILREKPNSSGQSPFRSSFRKEFSPRKKRIGWIFGALFIAAFWNGIVSVFVFQAVESWKRNDPDWFLTLFMTPFVLIGLALLLHVFYRILACFNAAPILTLAPAEITLGEATQLEWKTLSGEHKISHFAIYLVSEEEAHYRRGTNTVTDTSVFYEQVLLDTKDPRKVRRGESEILLSSDLMPSWKSSNNAIKWSLRVRGEISLWPDIKDNYEVTVLPANSQH